MAKTRQEMIDIIATGGGVIHNGQIHTSVATLPTETDLAEGDAALTQAALDGIDEQQRSLDAQRTRLLATQAQGPGGGRGKAKKGGSADAGQAGEDAPPPDDGGKQPGGAV